MFLGGVVGGGGLGLVSLDLLIMTLIYIFL